MGKKVAPEENRENRISITPPAPPEYNEKKETKTAAGKDLHRVRSSFRELVVYNNQGQPTIDINRLIYKPKIKLIDREKEQLSWYLPDYVFIIFNFLSLTYSTYYFINGITIISWRNSMQIFTLDNCKDGPEICKVISKEYGGEDMSPFTMIRFYGISDTGVHGLCLLIFGAVNYFNICLGINACIDGSKSLLYTYLAIDAVLMVSEVLLVTVLHLSGTCDKRDVEIIRVFLEKHVENYASHGSNDLVKKQTMELDLIQLSLTCCGVGNWTDYLPRSSWDGSGSLKKSAIIQRTNLDSGDLIIPASCCRQWWTRNLYCSFEAHLWTNPTSGPMEAHKFRERISQHGCLPKMVELCKNIVALAGVGGMIAWAVHCFLSIVRICCSISQIERNNRMTINQTKKDRRANADKDENRERFPSLSSLFGFSSLYDEEEVDPDLPQPPKENDIAKMKSRKDFNMVRSATKDTHIENWMTKSQAFVERKDVIRANQHHGDMEYENHNLPRRQRNEPNLPSAHPEMSTEQALRLIRTVTNTDFKRKRR